METYFKKILLAGFGFLVLANSSFAEDKEIDPRVQKCITMMSDYYSLGIHPTKNEIISIGNKSGLDKAEIDFFIKKDKDEQVLLDYYDVQLKQLSAFATTAKEGEGSQSQTTRQMVQKVLRLIDSISAARSSRNVSLYKKIKIELLKKMDILADRLDAERSMEDMTRRFKKTEEMNLPYPEERKQIEAHIANFYWLEKNEKFIPTNLAKEIVAEFNAHSERVNLFLNNPR